MLDLRLLGGAALLDSRGTEVRSVLQQPKRWALLAYLAAARPRGFHRRDTLLALFWPELDQAAARNSLGQAVHFLRRELGTGVLVNRGRAELGLAEGTVRCDAVEMEREIAEGRPERGLALYRGDLLAGFHLAGAPELAHWADGERARLRALAADTARRLADARAEAGDTAEACRWMRFAAALDPLDERGVRRLLRLLDAAGDRSAALQAYDDFARRLRDELQAEPGAETRALAEALRGDRPAPAAASPAPPSPASPAMRAAAALPTFASPPAFASPPHAAPAASIAVLPFVDMSPEPQAYFADGLTEELISALALIEGMRVTSRTSSFAFKGRAQPLRAVAAELGVATVLEGSVRCVEGRVRVVAQLIDAATDTHLWTDAYERPLRDVLGIQTRVAEQIARALRVELSPAARGRMDARPTGSPRALDLYLQGRHHAGQGSREAWPRAVECFRRAIEEDPRFALAYCGLADVYLHTSLLPFLPPVPRAEAREKGRIAALRALELNEELGEAHRALAVTRWYAWDWEGAERAFRRALMLEPGDAAAHQRWAVCLCALGRFDEALREIRRAQELDPLSLGVAVDRALVDLRARRYPLAIAQLERVLEVDPEYAPALHFLAEAFAFSGQMEASARVWERRGRLTAEQRREMEALLRAHDERGYHRAWVKVVEENGAAPGVMAGSWARAGEMARAWEWMERALAERDPVLADAVRLHPGFDSMRQDPRWEGVLRRMGIDDPPPVPDPPALTRPSLDPEPAPRPV